MYRCNVNSKVGYSKRTLLCMLMINCEMQHDVYSYIRRAVSKIFVIEQECNANIIFFNNLAVDPTSANILPPLQMEEELQAPVLTPDEINIPINTVPATPPNLQGYFAYSDASL